MKKRNKLKVATKKTLRQPEPKIDTVTGTVTTTDTATIITFEKVCERCQELSQQVAYLNNQLDSLSKRDAMLYLENQRLLSLRVNMLKALGLEAQ